MGNMKEDVDTLIECRRIQYKEELISRVKENFDIRELVCPHTYKRWGKELSWQFLQADLLAVIYILRSRILKVPMVVNTWASGGDFDERGLRCNLCELVRSKAGKGVLYLSPHCMGAAIDFHTKEYVPELVRKMIRENWHRYSTIPIRIERDVNWVHIDIFDRANGKLITEFNG